MFTENRSFLNPKSQRGAALVMALFVITVLTVLGVMVLNSSIVEIKMAANQKISTKVFYAAEAGLERVLNMLVTDSENDTGTNAPWGNNTFAFATTVTATNNTGSVTFDVNVRSVDMYLNSPSVRRLTFAGGGNTLGNSTYQLYLYTPSDSEAYILSYATNPNGAAAVEYHLKIEDFSAYNNAIFTGSGIAGSFNGSVDLVGSVYSKGDMNPTGSVGIYNSYADAQHGLGGLAGLITDVADIEAKIRVSGGDFMIGSGGVGIGTSSNSLAGIYVDGNTNVNPGSHYYDDFSAEVPDVDMPGILDGLKEQYGDGIVAGYGGTDAQIAEAIYSDLINAQGPFSSDDTGGYVHNGDLTITASTGDFSYTDAYGNGISWDNASNALTIQGSVVIKGSLTVGYKNGNFDYVAVGAADSGSASDPEAGATIFVRDVVTIDGNFLAKDGYLKGGTETNSLGITTPGTVNFSGKPGNAYTGFFYAETQINFNKQAKLGGTVIGGVVNYAQVPDVFQVPALKDYLPPIMPGGQTVLTFTTREWRRVY